MHHKCYIDLPHIMGPSIFTTGPPVAAKKTRVSILPAWKIVVQTIVMFVTWILVVPLLKNPSSKFDTKRPCCLLSHPSLPSLSLELVLAGLIRQNVNALTPLVAGLVLTEAH